MKKKRRRRVRKIKLFKAIFINLVLTGIIIAVILGAALKISSKYQLKQSEDGYYEIYNARDFRMFLQSVHSLGKCRLMRDIYLNESSDHETWILQPADNERLSNEAIECFNGVLDGNGHTIYGLYSENGYGLFRINYGRIENLTIKESVIKGSTIVGGICGTNHGTIRECYFNGIVYGGNNCEELAGFCNLNLSDGVIENCGFGGILDSAGNVLSAAGIAPVNTGKIVNCYNLSERLPSANIRYGIADNGTHNCYMKADTEGMRPADGEVTFLDAGELLYISYYIDSDWNGLWQAKQNPFSWQNSYLKTIRNEPKTKCIKWNDLENRGNKSSINVNLNDVFVSEIISTMLGNQRLEFKDISFWREENAGSADFSMKLQCEEEDIQIDTYHINDEIYEDYDKLWEECARILEVKGKESWEHKTWLMTPRADSGTFKTPGKLLVYQYEEETGLFYFTESKAYRVTFLHGSCQYLPDDVAACMKSMADGKITWDTQLSDWQLITVQLCREMQPGDGGIWAEEAKEAIYQSIQDSDSLLVCVEDIRNLELILFYHTRLENLDFITAMKSLDTITIYGCGLEDISALSEGSDSLTHLYLYNNRISDISALAECHNLSQVNIEDNYISDISPLKNLERLEVLNISGNDIKDFSPISEMKHLYRLRISEEQIENIDDFITVPYLEVSDYGSKILTWEERKEIALNQMEMVLGKTDCKVLDVSMKDLNGDKIADLIILAQEEAETWLYVFSAIKEEEYELFYSGGLGAKLSDVAEIYVSGHEMMILDDVSNYSMEGTRRIIVCEYSDGGISTKWETRLEKYVFGFGKEFEILNYEADTYEKYYVYDMDGDGTMEKTAVDKEDGPEMIYYRKVLDELIMLLKTKWPENDYLTVPEGINYAGECFLNFYCKSEEYQPCYSLMDLSGEGIDELIIGMKYSGYDGKDHYIVNSIFTCQNGTVANIFGQYIENPMSQYWGICEDGEIEISRAVYGYGDYWYYKLMPYEAEAEMKETVGYKLDCDGNRTYYDGEEKTIAEMEFNKVLGRHQAVSIEWKEMH